MSLLPPFSRNSTPTNILSGVALLLLHHPQPHPAVQYLLAYLTGFHLSFFPSPPVVPILLSLLLPSPTPLNTPPLLLHLSLSATPLLLTTICYPLPLSQNVIFSTALITTLLSLLLLLNSPTHPISSTLPPLTIYLPIPVFNLRHAASIFNLRQDISTLLHNIPLIPSPRFIYKTLNSSIFVLLGALTRSLGTHVSAISHLRSSAYLASIGWLLTEIRINSLQDGLPSCLILSLSAVLILLIHRATIFLSPRLRSLLFPLAVLGGNFLTALVFIEVRLIERVLDGIIVGGVSALTLVKGICEVMGTGNAVIADGFYGAFKIIVLFLIMMSLEGTLPLAMFNLGRRKFEVAGGQRLGSRLD